MTHHYFRVYPNGDRDWVIGQSGNMTHSCLHLRALTPTGGLRHLDQPEVVDK